MKTIAELFVVPHSLQRYETVGDWEINRNGKLKITVSELGNEKYEKLVALHELVEVILCEAAGITDGQVTDFDKAFEARREEGNTDEPGDDPHSPYRHEHRIATIVEMIVADALGVDWRDYEEKINAL